jgi:hypothetical protein
VNNLTNLPTPPITFPVINATTMAAVPYYFDSALVFSPDIIFKFTNESNGIAEDHHFGIKSALLFGFIL